jgi:serine/threonine-protein kinase
MDWIVMPVYTHHGQEMELPDITEHSLEDAQRILDAKGFKLIKDREKFDSNYPKGTVIFQNPAPYSKAKKGRRIYVTVSSGDRPVTVPNLVGVSERDAAFLLNRAGLILGSVSTGFNDYYPSGVVYQQSVPAETDVQVRAMVDIIVSRGPLPSRFVVPEVIGKNIETAKKILFEAGLETGRIRYEIWKNLIPGTVTGQDPSAGSEVGQGRTVELTVSRTE